MTKNTLYHFITIFLLSLPSHGNTQPTTTTNQEQSTLLAVKRHWSSSPSASLARWSPSSDHCTWPGITCDSSGSVTTLTLPDQNITQTIPPSLCNLPNLTHLDLQWNYIPGPFPTTLYNCSNLNHLDLSDNYFVGTLPDDIHLLSPHLKTLNLSSNNLTGNIPASIGRISNLLNLILSVSMYNGPFPEEIFNLLNLEELSLSGNSFHPQPIPSNFTNLKKLKKFWMADANLIGEIPDGVGPALESIDLSGNTLTGAIPNSLFLLENLTLLYLFNNRLSGFIPQRVESLKLQDLDLSNNTLNGTIPDDFGSLTSLSGLSLFFNQFSGVVPASIGRLPALVDVKLFTNNLSGELPPDFGRYSPLETLQVSENQFVGELPKHLCANKTFIGLIAFENKLTGELPESLKNCSSLVIIRVHDNQLSGGVPDGLWTSPNLKALMLGNNAFSGELPAKVGGCLSSVQVMNNQFSGPIPAGISSWVNLTEFKGSNNSFTGVIPQEITYLSLVNTVFLDGNQLFGHLPLEIISWKSLAKLDLRRNQLSGEIPSELGLLPGLVYLDLSENKFSGRIPPVIGLLKLSSLNLSSNRLYGRIPGEYENAAFDRSFLDNPNLCSNIPSLGLENCRPKITRKEKRVSPHFIAAVSSIAAVAFLVAFLYVIYLRKSYRKRNLLSDSSWKLTSFQRLDFTETNILSSLKDENQIGSGGSGRVYRVLINHRLGKFVAVKSIWDNKKFDRKLEKEFLAEVRILGTIRHSNIVKLLCCISSESSKLLVYEYMGNHSLDRWLHGKRRPQSTEGAVELYNEVLDWPKRLRIAIGAAQGLCYMHHHCSPPIIHRDVKSSNILLDSEFNAKIADFGLARTLVKQGEPNTMSAVAGSFGYMAPEYAQTRRVNEKIDVYSFGAVLLELVSGREAHNGDETSSIAQWIWRHFQEGKPMVDAVDEDIKDPDYMEDINTVMKLGLICTSTVPSNRPPMNDVLQILLRCSQRLPPVEKTVRNEYEVAPLLQNSKPDN